MVSLTRLGIHKNEQKMIKKNHFFFYGYCVCIFFFFYFIKPIVTSFSYSFIFRWNSFKFYDRQIITTNTYYVWNIFCTILFLRCNEYYFPLPYPRGNVNTWRRIEKARVFIIPFFFWLRFNVEFKTWNHYSWDQMWSDYILSEVKDLRLRMVST